MHGIVDVWRRWRSDRATVEERVADGIVAAMFGVMVGSGGTVRVARADSLTAGFDWSMPARFGLDRNQAGRVEYVDGASDVITGYEATPGSWQVDLNAYASTAESDGAYHWTVIDHPSDVGRRTLAR